MGWRKEDGTGRGREDLTGEISRMPRLELLPRDRVTGSFVYSSLKLLHLFFILCYEHGRHFSLVLHCELIALKAKKAWTTDNVIVIYSLACMKRRDIRSSKVNPKLPS